jgi:hypothetical protein
MLCRWGELVGGLAVFNGEDTEASIIVVSLRVLESLLSYTVGIRAMCCAMW